MARFSPEDRETIWDMREAGVPVKRIARHLGRQNSSLRRFIADAGGRRPTPRERSELRLTLAEELVLGTTLDARACAAAQEAAARQVHPGDDVHASAAFRRKLTGVLLRRALVRVRARKEEGDGA